MSSNSLTPGPDTPAEVDEVVRHTDSGSGASQAEHWPPNVDTPDEGRSGAPESRFSDTGSV